MTRETARLKGKLLGKRRFREGEEHDASPSKTGEHSDDEGESRAGAIKKKARPDIFSNDYGKKKKNKEGSTLPFHLGQKVPSSGKNSAVESSDIIEDPVPMDRSLTKPSKTGTLPTANEQAVGNIEATQVSSALQTISTGTTGNTRTVAESTPNETTVTSGTKAFSPKSIPAELLKAPLLNLHGPINVSDPESADDGVTGTPLTSPKKKRKRRKKKKHPV